MKSYKSGKRCCRARNVIPLNSFRKSDCSTSWESSSLPLPSTPSPSSSYKAECRSEHSWSNTYVADICPLWPVSWLEPGCRWVKPGPIWLFYFSPLRPSRNKTGWDFPPCPADTKHNLRPSLERSVKIFLLNTQLGAVLNKYEVDCRQKLTHKHREMLLKPTAAAAAVYKQTSIYSMGGSRRAQLGHAQSSAGKENIFFNNQNIGCFLEFSVLNFKIMMSEYFDAHFKTISNRMMNYFFVLKMPCIFLQAKVVSARGWAVGGLD